MVQNNDTSLCSLSSGPSYTYFRGDIHTTTDYIISDARHAHLAIRCETHDHHPLNFSDHLPLSLTLSLTPTANAAPSTTRSQPRLHWRAASEEGSVEAYATRVDEIVRPHLGKTYNSISSLDEEVRHVSASIVHAASSIIPTCKPKKDKKRFSTDPELRDLSTRCKSAWKKWKKAGRPSQGPEHEEKKRLSRLTK